MMLSIHILPETLPAPPLWVCAELRLMNPLTHPSVQHRVKVTFSLDGKLPDGRLDVVLVQRAGWPGLTLARAQELVRTIRVRGAKLAYDIDDDLLCTHPIPSIDAELERGRSVIRLLGQ